MRNFLLFLTIISVSLPACRSKIKQSDDNVYSRHLQRHVGITVITTPMPKQKEKMNLLLFNADKTMVETIRAKEIIDSLYKKNLIGPLILVAFEGKPGDYGLTEAGGPEAKQYKKFNDFVTGELPPFIQKKTGIDHFNSAAICGFSETALNSFEIALNMNLKAGLFSPAFVQEGNGNIGEKINRYYNPDMHFWLSPATGDSTSTVFTDAVSKTFPGTKISGDGFADFLVWAFPKQ